MKFLEPCVLHMHTVVSRGFISSSLYSNSVCVLRYTHIHSHTGIHTHTVITLSFSPFMVSKSRQYTSALTLRACLYTNRHESCSVSVSWNVCAPAYEHRSQRGVQFKDAFAFWFVSVPSEQLLTAPALHIHSHFQSFSQRGTLVFTSCLNNLTNKGLGHLSFSLSHTHSLHHFPLLTST
jgi:hypothetical protein